uniref:SCHIP-1 domain-containing protein n=1 Tax=Anopheles epiroticus TaxID=199890 RepID=A0A182PE26_9DIPT
MCTRIRKGIINPNYPGFQSLAYTLNDDNFDYSSENPSDDDEDSYVSESDDNELKQHERKEENRREEPGDENGNSYDRGTNGSASEHGMNLNSFMDIPKVSATLYQHSSSTAAFEPETEFFPPDSPFHRTRMRLIPTGRSNSPALTTAMFGTELEKLDSAMVYACTPPDIVLQHSYEHRTSVFGSSKELAKSTLEHASSQKPDLIPEQQSVEQGTLPPLQNDRSEQDHSVKPLTDGLENVVTKTEHNANENESEEDDDEQDIEGNNRSPPSPAIELLRAVDQFSISDGNYVGNPFEQQTILPPDQVLDETIQCYDGLVTDEPLSDDSEQESEEEAEFEYKPYNGPDSSSRNTYATSPSDVPASIGDSGDSAGSSPGEVQYHLVDDCSNQTVQITRSRQSTEQSPTNHHYHLLQQYATSVGVDYCANTSEDGREINCNDYYDSSPGQHAQTDFAQFERQYSARSERAAVIRSQTIAMEYSDPRPTRLNLARRDTETAQTAADMSPSTFQDKTTFDKPQTLSTETVVPARQYQKVPKVNPFCEALLQDNDTYDFFTKQAKLQIEARMALCQAKDMAHMQMEIEKRSLPLSPVTRVIHTAVEKAGLCLAPDKRRLSRYYLTRLNVSQLQTILTELQGHAEVLNEELVELLMERDELHISQDATLIDIEDLSRYLCAKEQTIMHAERQRKSHYWNSTRTAAHLQPHQKQPSLPQPAIRSTCGSAIPAYRYH